MTSKISGEKLDVNLHLSVKAAMSTGPEFQEEVNEGTTDYMFHLMSLLMILYFTLLLH